MINITDLVEIELASPEDFLKVKETLTRIGVASRKEKKLYQSCHILHKQKRYFIVHFKELFALDGKPSNFSDEDKKRRNAIATLLEQWNLCKIISPEEVTADVAPISQIKIISHKEKSDWVLETKYTIGIKKK